MNIVVRSSLLFTVALGALLALHAVSICRLGDCFFEELEPTFQHFNEANRTFFCSQDTDGVIQQYSKIEKMGKELIERVDIKLTDADTPEAQKKLFVQLKKRVKSRILNAKERMSRCCARQQRAFCSV